MKNTATGAKDKVASKKVLMDIEQYTKITDTVKSLDDADKIATESAARNTKEAVFERARGRIYEVKSITVFLVPYLNKI